MVTHSLAVSDKGWCDVNLEKEAAGDGESEREREEEGRQQRKQSRGKQKIEKLFRSRKRQHEQLRGGCDDMMKTGTEEQRSWGGGLYSWRKASGMEDKKKR